MINWRSGLAGFVNGSKYLIKGVFRYQYSVTTESVSITIPLSRTDSTPYENRTDITFDENRVDITPYRVKQ